MATKKSNKRFAVIERDDLMTLEQAKKDCSHDWFDDPVVVELVYSVKKTTELQKA